MFSPISIQPWQSSTLKRVIISIAAVMLLITVLLVYLTSFSVALPSSLIMIALASRHFLRLRTIDRIEITQQACSIHLRSGEAHTCFFGQASKLFPQFIDLTLISVDRQHRWWSPIFEDAVVAGQFSDLRLYLQDKHR